MHFKCTGCDISLKKTKVEKHLMTKCTNAKIRCLGCDKNLSGKKWKSHTTCLSEPEKIKTLEPIKKATEPSKVEKRQRRWNKLVLKTLELAEADSRQKNLLEAILKKAKVPHGREKIEAFVKQSIPRGLRNLARKIFSKADESNPFHKKNEVLSPSKKTSARTEQKVVNRAISIRNAKRRDVTKTKRGLNGGQKNAERVQRLLKLTSL